MHYHIKYLFGAINFLMQNPLILFPVNMWVRFIRYLLEMLQMFLASNHDPILHHIIIVRNQTREYNMGNDFARIRVQVF
jgi:hypothetical protein